MFQPHRNLSDRINGDIIRSEIEGGVYLKDLPDQTTLEILTENRPYMLTVRRDGMKHFMEGARLVGMAVAESPELKARKRRKDAQAHAR